jgi:cobalamin biosynthesis protein CbiD
MDLGALAVWLEADGGPAPLTRAVREANTARHALEILREREALHFSASVGRRLLSTARDRLGSDIRVWAVILDETGAVLFEEQGGSGKCSILSIS